MNDIFKEQVVQEYLFRPRLMINDWLKPMEGPRVHRLKNESLPIEPWTGRMKKKADQDSLLCFLQVGCFILGRTSEKPGFTTISVIFGHYLVWSDNKDASITIKLFLS